MDKSLSANDIQFYHEALAQAKQGLKEGGIPIGAVLVFDGKIVGKGRNRRLQHDSAILHGEMDALENAGRFHANIYQKCTLYTTLSPCDMCTGAALLYKIPRIVIGENQNFKGNETQLREKGVELIILQDKETIQMMAHFIQKNPKIWCEDIGKED